MGEFEKDIRDMFTDLEIPIDTNEIWPGIVNGIEKKDKKYPIWWFLIPIVMISLGGIYLLSTNQTNEIDKTGVAVVNNLGERNNNKSIAKIAKLENQENLKENEEDLNIKEQKIVNTSKTNNKTETANQVNNTKNQINNNKTNNLDNNSSTIINHNLDKQNNIINNNDEELNSKNTKISKEIIVINLLKSRLLQLYYNRNFTLKMNSIKVFDVKRKLKKSPLEKSFDIGLGFAFVNKSLSLTNVDYQNYINKRIETESYLEAITSNLGFNFKHNSGFFVSTGLNYTQIDERFSDIDSVDIYKENEGITKQIQDSEGGITTLRGQKEVVEHKTWDKIIYNYYFFLDIPLSIGYSFDVNKVKFEISSGISYNIAFLKNGQILGLEGFPVDIANNKNLFKRSTGLNFISNAKIMYPYKNHLFYLEPNIKYNLNKVTLDQNPIDQKYFTYGLKIGSRFNF